MLWPKKNSYKEFDSEKKFLRLENSPPPHNFCNGPSLSTRLTDHKQATGNGNVNNYIAEYYFWTKHEIHLDSATCITYSKDCYQRLTLESWLLN